MSIKNAFYNYTNAVASRYVQPVSAKQGNDKVEKKRNTRFIRSAQAREERSLSLPQKTPLTDVFKLSSSSSTNTAPDSILIDDAAQNNASPLSWPRISQQEAIILLATTTLGFSFLATDLVFLHSLRCLDTGIHLFISNHVSAELHDFARHTMSNAPIVLGWCGWIAAAGALLYSNNNDKIPIDNELKNFRMSTAIRHLCISISIYLIGGGTILHGDPWLVSIIKGIFHRTRPSELSSTYAFPSGHTTSAAFLMGALMCVILPAVLDTFVQVPDKSNTPSTRSKKVNSPLENGVSLAVEKVQENRILIWILCVAVTASGRVVADVHWTSDVMAGACLGTGLVALTVLACEISDALVNSGKE